MSSSSDALGIVLNQKLEFKFHVHQKIKKYNKLVGLIRKLSVNVPRKDQCTVSHEWPMYG